MPASRNGKTACENRKELAELAHLRKHIERILTESLNKAWNEETDESGASDVANEVGRTVNELLNKCWDEVSESEDSDTFDTSESKSSPLSGDEADIIADSLLDDLDARVRTASARPLTGEELSPEELELYRNTFELGWGDDVDDVSEDSSGYGAVSGLEVVGEELDLYRRTFDEGWE